MLLGSSRIPGLAACERLGNVNPNESIDLTVRLTPGVALDSQGLQVTAQDADSVHLRGTAAQCEKAFGVQLGRYRDADGHEFRAPSGLITVQDGVFGVFGLDNRPIAQRVRGAAPRDQGPYTPQQVASAYGFPKGDGSGQTLAIIELDGGYRPQDLKSYFSNVGVRMPSISDVSVDGGQNAPSGDANGPDGEVTMDIDVAGAIAPGARIQVYFAPNTEQGFMDAVNQAAKDHAGAISISWAGPESYWSAQGLDNFNQVLQNAANSGINVFAASGDAGSSDGLSDGKNHVVFPAASPYAIATGGTNLTLNNGMRSSETAWNTGKQASGGGVSGHFAEPDWQVSAGVQTSGRGVPDVAGPALPGYAITVDGKDITLGGTSAVAPLWAGLALRMAQDKGSPIGFLSPLLYRNPSTLYDITSGNNGAFKAGNGWDAVTGLGSPNAQKLYNVVKSS